jgi:hypothetical protein
LAAYHAEDPIEALVCDDAPQYKLLALLVVLCGVHEGRHYKKLNPSKALELEAQFDDLTARVTGYKDLDERIAKTKKKKRYYC